MLCGEERGQVHDASVLFMSCHCHAVSRRGKTRRALGCTATDVPYVSVACRLHCDRVFLSMSSAPKECKHDGVN